MIDTTLRFLFLMEGPLDGWKTAIRSHKGNVFTGRDSRATHSSIAREMLQKEYGGDKEEMSKWFRNREEMVNQDVEGFITPDGEFLDREKAFGMWTGLGGGVNYEEEESLDSTDLADYYDLGGGIFEGESTKPRGVMSNSVL